jgi:hypothetical protein
MKGHPNKRRVSKNWDQMGAYIQNNSGAQIIQGIFPDCIKKICGNSLREGSDSIQ